MVIRFRWGCECSILMMGLCPYKKRKKSQPAPSTMWSSNKKVAVCKPGTERSADRHRICWHLDLQLPGTMKNRFGLRYWVLNHLSHWLPHQCLLLIYFFFKFWDRYSQHYPGRPQNFGLPISASQSAEVKEMHYNAQHMKLIFIAVNGLWWGHRTILTIIWELRWFSENN